MDNYMIICECGCGTEIDRFDNRGRPMRFVFNHHRRDVKLTEETLQKMRGNKNHLGHTHSEETKQKIREAKLREYANSGHPRVGMHHSEESKQKMRLVKLDPNKTDEEKQYRGYPAYDTWRMAVLERDNFTCQLCGKGRDLKVHHLEGYANNPELRTTLSNGIILCGNCHNDFHHCYGYNNTIEQFKEFESMER